MAQTLSPALMHALSATLAERIGLSFPETRWHDLERGLFTAAAALGTSDLQSCAYKILSGPPHYLETLVRTLTIGETYFMRDGPLFEALAQHVLPELIRARASAGRRLRLWSAGCCTGEEPYSIAMLLDRMRTPSSDWSATILATDINTEFLAKAAAAVYGKWSFRNTPDWVKTNYFSPKNNSDHFILQDRIRQSVTFAYLNLADNTYPSLETNTNAMDIILCRNVLMYFSPEHAQAVVARFHRSLVDGGWLIVSPAETSLTRFTEFSSVQLPGAMLYRKTKSTDIARLKPNAPVRVTHAPKESLPAPIRATPSLPAPALPHAASHQADVCGAHTDQSDRSTSLERTARKEANLGNLEAAARQCIMAIELDKLNPKLHYLLAIIRIEQGEADAAILSLKRVLFLDPHFALANYTLGNLLEAQGSRRNAQRCFSNAIRELRARPPDQILPDSGGITAGHLADIIALTQLHTVSRLRA